FPFFTPLPRVVSIHAECCLLHSLCFPVLGEGGGSDLEESSMSRTLARAATGACGALVLTAASVVVGGVSTASAADGCSVEYTVASDWGSGFTADVTVTNDSGGPVTGWTVEWTLPSGHTITNAWNATVSVDGAAVRAVNAGWNGALPSGGSASFGLQGTGSGASSV